MVGVGEVWEMQVVGHKPSGRAYSNVIHYQVSMVSIGSSITAEEIAQGFYLAFQGNGMPAAGLGARMSNETVLDYALARRVSGVISEDSRFAKYEYDEDGLYPWIDLLGRAIPALPSGTALRIDKVTGDPATYWKGRIHLGSIPEDDTEPGGDLLTPTAFLAFSDAAEELEYIIGTGLSGNYSLQMVVLSGTEWVREGGTVQDHVRDVLHFWPRPMVGSLVRRKPPYTV